MDVPGCSFVGLCPPSGERLLGKLQIIIHDEEFLIWFHIPFEGMFRKVL
jgi:hypothetical protein